MAYSLDLDRQAALDGNLPARMRHEVVIPFNKILKDFLHQNNALAPEDRQKHVHHFNDEVINLFASSIILWMHAQGVRGKLLPLVLPLLLDQIHQQTLKIEEKSR